MTEQDYIAMAKDYEFQVEVITNKLNKLENQMAKSYEVLKGRMLFHNMSYCKKCGWSAVAQQES